VLDTSISPIERPDFPGLGVYLGGYLGANLLTS
jgi:hypothetical protein